MHFFLKKKKKSGQLLWQIIELLKKSDEIKHLTCKQILKITSPEATNKLRAKATGGMEKSEYQETD